MSDDDEHNPDDGEEGVFDKEASATYRATCEGCRKGYHGNRWDAHHILPGTVFTITRKKENDPIGFIARCLDATDYDINAKYSMAGMPKLTAFILYFQQTTTMTAAERAKEKTVTMKRWNNVKQYKNQMDKPIVFPGDIPVHNPVNWGHTKYNEDVLAKLDSDVFDKLRKNKDKTKHYKSKNLKTQINTVKNHFWNKLKARGSGTGIAGKTGIKANLLARHQAKNNGWWKPLCMADVPEPASP